MTPVKLFLVAVDGHAPWDWKPFGTRALQELSQKFKEEVENKHCSVTFQIEITTEKIEDISEDMAPRVIGCIVDLDSYCKSNQNVHKNLQKFAFTMRKKSQNNTVMPLYILSNINRKHQDAEKGLHALKGQLAISGYRANDIQVHPLSEDDDIASSISIIATNIAMNELLHDWLGLK